MGCPFDQVVERRSTGCVKWDGLLESFGREDLLPMWVADMDFRPPEAVVQAVTQRAQHGIYGYEKRPASFDEAVLGWLQSRHGWDVDPAWLIHTPGVVAGLTFAVLALTEPGERVVIQPPVYPPFFAILRSNGREVVENPLVESGGRYVMNFEELEEFFKLTGAAVLALDRRIPQFKGPWIGGDPYPGARQAVQHLLDLGHRNIGLVRGVEGNISSDERYKALNRALVEAGLPEERWTWVGEYTLETGIAAGLALAELPAQKRPTAVIATSEFSAYGLIEGVSRHGISVPDQLSVVGYDNTAFAEVFRPALTVIAQPIEEMGELAVDFILRMINNAEQDEQLPPVAPVAGMRPPAAVKEPVEDAVLPTYLVIRSSTAPARPVSSS